MVSSMERQAWGGSILQMRQILPNLPPIVFDHTQFWSNKADILPSGSTPALKWGPQDTT